MNAGLPGLGLSGLFALLSALVLPWTRRRLRSRRRQIVALTVMGALLSACAVGMWDLLLAGARVTNSLGRGGTASSGWLGPVPVIVVSLAILSAIVLVAEVLSLVLNARRTPTPPPVRELTVPRPGT
jgi:MFS family permease